MMSKYSVTYVGRINTFCGKQNRTIHHCPPSFSWFRKTKEEKEVETKPIETVPEIMHDELAETHDSLEKKRNKSQLLPGHYRSFHKIPTPLSEDEEQVYTLKRQRKLYARYGSASEVDVAKLWPSKEELHWAREYEKVAFPHSIMDMIQIAQNEKNEKLVAIDRREIEILANVRKLEGWKNELTNRIAKRDSEAIAAKAKKDQLVEEVRQIFGYRIDPRDERFKEALEKKEKEEKRANKETRKREKERRLVMNLQSEIAAAKKDNTEGNEVDDNDEVNSIGEDNKDNDL